jgi:Uma2 family endonuclease
MTVEQFAEMVTDETADYELVEGELVLLSSGTPWHNEIRDLVAYFLRGYFRANPLGKVYVEIDCRVGEDTVRKPDVSVFLAERVKQIDRKKIPIQFAPDIAVEVISPSERAIDVNRKVRDYRGAGSLEVWLIDAENGEIVVYSETGIRMLEAADTLTTPLLPGFSVPVAELLA